MHYFSKVLHKKMAKEHDWGIEMKVVVVGDGNVGKTSLLMRLESIIFKKSFLN